MNDSLNKVTELLRELPGIGPRQARRLSFWLMRKEAGWVNTFARSLLEARKGIHTCPMCTRLYEAGPHDTGTCRTCEDPSRDASMLLIVEKDVDLENIERTGTYRGLYFVLGGTTGPLDKQPEQRIRIEHLMRRLREPREPIKEVIFALSATTEGEDTSAYVREQIDRAYPQHSYTLSELGRGLSTGTELEYVDADTMRSALERRT